MRGDTSGTFADFNTYYFFGTAGSVIDASLTRVDASLSWENPASLDPQLEIVAPDGLIYENLRKVDDQPGADYNASLTGSILPLTGIYYVKAETLKGSGAYRLTFAFTSVAPAPIASRTIPFAGNFNTVPVNGDVTATAFLLDPRGYTLSGAEVTFGVVPGADDTGSVQFVTPATTLSTWEGAAGVTVKLTGQGKVQLGPSLTSPILAQWSVVLKEGEVERAVPRYTPVGVWPVLAVDMDEEGRIYQEEGAREELPVWHAAPAESTRSPGYSGGGEGARTPSGEAVSMEAVKPISVSVTKAAEAITSCATAVFVEAGANVAAVQPPFTVVVTDLTPSTGQSQQNGVVGAEGIHGHRVEKTIRLKLEITDGTGVAPTYPVLVHLALSGPKHGKLILDPDGNRVECDQASFLWHERDAQGNIIALNEELEYKLGTYAPFVGAVPDPQNPPSLKPVWGTGEVLGLVISTVDSGGVTTQLMKTYKVHPEPGKPDHFAISVPPPPAGSPEVVWTVWPDWAPNDLGVRSDGSCLRTA